MRLDLSGLDSLGQAHVPDSSSNKAIYNRLIVSDHQRELCISSIRI